MLVVANNTTGVGITVAYGRPPHSLEMVVAGGSNAAVAEAIYTAAPAGIATYGAPVLRTTASVAAGSAACTVSSSAGLAPGMLARCMGLPQGTLIAAVSGQTLTLSASAIASYSNTAATFGYGALLSDANSNPVLVAFSRPQLLPVYVVLTLVTDTFLVPGNPASGVNPAAMFAPASVATVEAAIAAAINAVPIGGTLVGLGTNGLLSCFSSVPGHRQLRYGLRAGPVAERRHQRFAAAAAGAIGRG